MRDSNFPDINWECHPAVMSRPWEALKFVGGNFSSQVLCEPTRKDALLDLFVTREGLLGDVMVGGCLADSDQQLDSRILMVL